MYNWQKWIWPGILSIAVATLLAVGLNKDVIQQDLLKEAKKHLVDSHRWAELSIDGRDLALSGTAPSEQSQRQAEQILGAVDGIRIVQNDAGLVPVQKPFDTTIKREGNQFLIEGFVPGNGASDQLTAIIQKSVPDAEVVFHTTPARGAPKSYLEINEFGVSKILAQNDGKISLSDNKFGFAGTASSIDQFKYLQKTLGGKLPGGAVAGTIDITPPKLTPYILAIQKSNNLLTLSGYVPSQEQRARLLDTVKNAGFSAVDDKMDMAAGNPDGFDMLAEFAIKQLSYLSQGAANLEDLSLTVMGQANSIAGYKLSLSALNGKLPGGGTLESASISPPNISPYIFSAKKTAAGIELSGYVSSNGERDLLLQGAKKAAGGLGVKDNTDLVLGAPSGFRSLASFGFSQLAELSSGAIELSDEKYSISGVAASVENYNLVVAAAKGTLPGNGMLNTIDVSGPTRSPYTFSAQRSSDGITLSGYVPSQTIKSDLMAQADALMPGQAIDKLDLSFGNPDQFETLASFGVDLLSMLNIGSVAISGTDISVSGSAASIGAYNDITKLLSGPIPAKGMIVDQDIKRPLVEPYEFTAEKSGDQIALSGYAPNETILASRIEFAKQSNRGIKIIEQTELAQGGSSDFETLTLYGISLLGQMSDGKVNLVGDGFSIEGTANDPEAFQKLNHTLGRALPAGGKLVSAGILPPIAKPYLFMAEKSGTTLNLSGHSPSPEVSRARMEFSQQLNSGSTLQDNVEIYGGAPEGFETIVQFGLSQLQHLEQGVVSISDRNVSISGTASTPDHYLKISETLGRPLPQGGRLKDVQITNATVSPFVFSVTKSANVLTIFGFVPSEDVEVAVVAAAKQAGDGLEIVNNSKLANGGHEKFQTLSTFVVSQLANLSEGVVSLSGTSVDVSGKAKSVEAYAAVTKALANPLPGDGTLSRIEISPATVDGFNWSAAYDGESVSLSGFTTDDKTRRELLSAASASLPSAKIADNTRIAKGAPEGFVEAAKFGLMNLQHVDSGSASISQRTITFRGTAKTPEAYERLIAMPSASPQGYTVDANGVKPATVAPYTWSADYDGKQVIFSGYVPDEQIRKSLISAATDSLPDVEISDETKIAAGANSNFNSAAKYNLGMLQRLSAGRAEISANAITITGTAKTPEDFERLITSPQTLPQGYTVITDGLKPAIVSPYTWSADYDGTQVGLSGYFPDEQTRKSIISAATEILPNADLRDETQIAAGEDPDFGTIVRFGLSQLQHLDQGILSMSDKNISISGIASTPDHYLKISETLGRPLPQGARLKDIQITNATVSPFTFSATKSAEAVTISGFVPTEDAEVAVVAAAKQAGEGLSIINNSKLANGSHEEFQTLSTFMVSQLANLSEGKVNLSGTSVDVSGTAKSVEAYEAIAMALANPLPGAGTLSTTGILPATVDGFTWTAAHDGTQLALSGYVPSAATKQDLISAAKESLPNAVIRDETKIAAGAGANFEDAARYNLGILQNLNNGRSDISVDTITLTGTAKSPQDYERLIATLAAPPEGYRVVADGVKPATVSPYTWSAEFDENKLSLNGYVPDDETRQAIKEAAGKSLPELEIVDNTATANGASSRYLPAVKFIIGTFDNLERGNATISDNTVTLNGDAKDFEAYDRLKKSLASGLPEGMVLKGEAISPPIVERYALEFTKNGSEVVVDGFFTDETSQREVISALSDTQSTESLIDNSHVSRGQPDGITWSDAAKFTMEQVLLLENGKAGLSAEGIAISGKPGSAENATTLKDNLSRLPLFGLKLAKSDIASTGIDPYVWELKRTGSNITAKGYVENDAVKTALSDAIKALDGIEEVDSEYAVEEGEPTDFSEARLIAINAIVRLVDAEIKMSNTSLSITGTALTGVAANTARQIVNSGLPEGFSGTHEIRVKEIKKDDFIQPDKCQKLMQSSLKNKQILFEANKSIIKPESYSLLDQLVYVTQQCPKSNIEIAGHTDADGTETYNQRLSEARAKSVAKYLTRSGVFPSRLDAKGYGESQPIADNETDEGKQKNRRIEFKVKEAG